MERQQHASIAGSWSPLRAAAPAPVPSSPSRLVFPPSARFSVSSDFFFDLMKPQQVRDPSA